MPFYHVFHRVTGVFSITLLVHWSIGPLVYWSIGPSVHWSIGPLVHWSISPFVRWSVVPLDYCFIGPLVECQILNVNKVKLLSELSVFCCPSLHTMSPIVVSSWSLDSVPSLVSFVAPSSEHCQLGVFLKDTLPMSYPAYNVPPCCVSLVSGQCLWVSFAALPSEHC